MSYFPHTPLAWAAIGTAWLIVAAAIAPKLGRAIKAADPGEDCDYNHCDCYTPTSVPQPSDDRAWLADQPAEILVDAELAGQFYGIVAREWYL
jgi:hypothetical protein